MSPRARILIADADAEARRRLRLPPREDEPAPPPGSAGGERAQTGLRGSLSLMGLPALLSHVEAGRLTGRLTLRGDALPGRALLDCREGRLLRARMGHSTSPRDAELVYALLPFEEGSFEFRPFPIGGDDDIGMSMTGLLLEGARRADEAIREQPRPALADRVGVSRGIYNVMTESVSTEARGEL